MAVCPSCQREVDEATRVSGRCPACGSTLRPIAQRTIADIRQSRPAPKEPEQLQSHDQTIELPSGMLDDSVDLQINVTMDLSSSSATIPELPKPPQEGIKPATVTFGPQQTIEFSGSGSASAIDESMLTSQWQGGVPQGGGNLGATIKQKETITGSYVSSSSLIVKSRHVAPTGHAARPVASPADAPDYELLNVIGEGGMGVVYAARQSSIARTVALKMLKSADADVSARDKFISEAVVTGELDHPNIVPIYDLGANDDGALFYSMKRVKGTPWNKVIRDRSLDENLNILLRVADAVAFAHVNGVIHRDLKPENVMLGDFGEVLVMDWGLARVNSQFASAGAVTQSDAMGGTPAYMAPEMATGPLELITPASDVYLLGAILYEIITGKPPHTGKSVMACLFSAAKNQIAATDKTGELVDVALKAMATNTAHRHPSVQQFQAAVREYQAHAESLRLLHHANDNLKQGAKAQDYELYARAIFALEESLTLWPGNKRSTDMLGTARVDYARLALAKGDYDLGASMLDPTVDAHREVLGQLQRGSSERESRQRRIKVLKGAVAALVASVVGIVSVAYFAVSKQRDVAVDAREKAVKAQSLEAEARLLAEGETKRAVAAEKTAEERRAAEEVARVEAVHQKSIAETEKAEADRQRGIAETAQHNEEYAAYVARIGVTKAKLDENSFDRAVELLAECPAYLRNWEWGRLRYLTRLTEKSLRAPAPLDAAAFSPDGVHFVTGGWDGNAAIWNLTTGQREHEMPQGQYVHAVAYDKQGERIAAGSSDGTVVIYRAATGERLAELKGHEDGVLSVRFSPDGKRLLSSGYDNTARLWDLATGKTLEVLQGHSWWVWAAEFSPDGELFVTAGEDGQAIVWHKPDPEKPYEILTSFAQHSGPVYAAKFSPDGKQIATAGEDGLVMLWDPMKVKAPDVKERIDALQLGHGEAASLPAPPVPHRELAGHRGPVRTLAFAPDGRSLASGGQDNLVIMWEVATGKPSGELRAHASHVRSCSFSADGKFLLTAGRDAQINLWRSGAFGETRQFATDDGARVLSARFSHDGSEVVTASSDRTASLWNVATLGRSQRFQEGHDFLASSAVFFDEGKRLATAAGDGTVRVWDVATGGETLRLDNTGRTAAVAVSDDGTRIATASGGVDAQIWDAATGEKIASLPGDKAEITAVRFSADGRMLAAGDDQGHCKLWRFDAAAKRWVAGPQFEVAHSRTITALAFADGGARLISASGDNTCGQWDTATGKELKGLVLKHPEWVGDMAVSSDGKLALTCCDDRKLRLWSLADAKLLRTIDTADTTEEPTIEVADRSATATETVDNQGALTAVDLSADGRLAVATCAGKGLVRVWNLATGEELNTPAEKDAPTPAWLEVGRGAGRLWATRFAPNSRQLLVIGGNDAQLRDLDTRDVVVSFSPHGAVSSADLSPDGSRLITGSWDRTAKIWDTATGHVVHKLPELHYDQINSVRYSPDGSRILTASDDGTARLWNAADGASLDVVLRGHKGAVRQACFSPDGSQILTVGDDKTARLWNSQTGAELRVPLEKHKWAVRSGAFSPDGKRIITGSEDNSAIVWDAVTGDVIITLEGHTAAVTAVALSLDGSRALTGSQDNSAKLWDATTGKEILTLAGHADEVTSVSFSPDGLTALTSGRDGRVLLWPAVDWKTADVQQAQRELHAAR